ncbi:MAG: hypothetical protein ACFFFG_10815 [Candidatus Thorarchaeota archaeon]
MLEFGNLSRFNFPPVVILLAPQIGEIYSTSPIPIQWQASDPDHDSLKCSLFYWDGEDWISIVANLGGSKYLWDIQGVPSGPYYRIRVVVSDGFLIAIDESSSPFTIERSQGTGTAIIWGFLGIFIATLSRMVYGLNKPKLKG